MYDESEPADTSRAVTSSAEPPETTSAVVTAVAEADAPSAPGPVGEGPPSPPVEAEHDAVAASEDEGESGGQGAIHDADAARQEAKGSSSTFTPYTIGDPGRAFVNTVGKPLRDSGFFHDVAADAVTVTDPEENRAWCCGAHPPAV